MTFLNNLRHIMAALKNFLIGCFKKGPILYVKCTIYFKSDSWQ